MYFDLNSIKEDQDDASSKSEINKIGKSKHIPKFSSKVNNQCDLNTVT